MNRLLITLFSFSLALAGATHAQATEKQTIVLTNGTTLVGEVLAESATEVTFRDSVLGTLQFSPAAITSRAAQTGSPAASSAGSATPSSLPTVGPALQPTTANPAAPTPKSPVWTRNLLVSFGHMSGAAPSLGQGSVRSLDVNMGIERAADHHINSLIVSYSLARAKPAPPYSNKFLATFQHDYILSPKNRIVSQTTFLRDPPKTITHRTEQLVAFARTLVLTPSTTLMVAPGLAYSFGEKEYVGDVDDQHFGYGLYQILNHTLSPTLSLQQKLKAVRSFSDPQYIRASASVSLTVQLTKTIGLKTSLESTYDRRPAQGIEELQYQTNTGLQIKF
jgi:putative salt-induced outer membrane protein YdiY